MNWFEIVNKTSKYIEKHLQEEIVLEDLAKHVAVSYSYFQKIFLMITNYSLNEYIRNRRLTVASYDVLHSNKKIIDIALEYQYGSNEAFSRAFKKVHGMSPNEARKNNVSVLTFFPQLKYDIPHDNVKKIQFYYDNDLELGFYGIIHHIKNTNQNSKQIVQNHINDFLKQENISDLASSKNTIYTVKYNVEDDYSCFDLLIGYRDDFNLDNTNLEHITFPRNNYLKYTGVSQDIESISSFEKKIYNEWAEYDFIYDNYREIEFITRDNNGLITFNLMVSFK